MSQLVNKMKTLKDTKRRMKQQALQTFGVVEATEDTEFMEEYNNYKRIITAVESIRKSMKSHIEAYQKQVASASALAIELAAFHQQTDMAKDAREYGQVHVEVERVQFSSMEKMYDLDVLSAVDMVLWHVPDVEEKVKRRKKLLLDYDAHLRKYEVCKQQMAEAHDRKASPDSKPKFLQRRKSESELAADLATRRMKLEHAEMAVDAITEELMTQFRDVAHKYDKGTIIQGPMASLLACQMHMSQQTSTKLGAVQDKYPNTSKHLESLTKYDAEFEKMSHFDLEGYANITNMNQNNRVSTTSRGGTTLRRGTTLESSTPALVCDSIAFLEDKGMETTGLFRVPGQQDTVQAIKRRYDGGETGILSTIPDVDVNDVCTLLKQFLRELSDPLICTQSYDGFLNAMRNTNTNGGDNTLAVDALLSVVTELPQANQELLGFLFQFLNAVAANAAVNKMTTVNLATCFAPSIMRAPDGVPPNVVLHDMQMAIAAVNLLIVNAKRLPRPSASDIKRNTTYKTKKKASSPKKMSVTPPPGMGFPVGGVTQPATTLASPRSKAMVTKSTTSSSTGSASKGKKIIPSSRANKLQKKQYNEKAICYDDPDL